MVFCLYSQTKFLLNLNTKPMWRSTQDGFFREEGDCQIYAPLESNCSFWLNWSKVFKGVDCLLLCLPYYNITAWSPCVDPAGLHYWRSRHMQPEWVWGFKCRWSSIVKRYLAFLDFLDYSWEHGGWWSLYFSVCIWVTSPWGPLMQFWLLIKKGRLNMNACN